MLQINWVLVVCSDCFRVKAANATFVERSCCQLLLYCYIAMSLYSLLSFLSRFGSSFQGKLFSFFYSFMRVCAMNESV